jgi:hypothetical protein
MKNSNILFYTPGAYGHFINWCCDYFSGNISSDIVPLDDLGTCHNYQHHYELYYPEYFKKYTESAEEYQFIQLHENSFNDTDNRDISAGKILEVLTKNLSYLQEHYKHVIYIFPTSTSKIWVTNNQIYKIRLADWCGMKNEQQAIKWLKSHNATDDQINVLLVCGLDKIKLLVNNQSQIIENFKGWGHQDINEFEIWELRELLSKYYFDRMSDNDRISDFVESELKNKFSNIKFIRLDDLRNSFEDTVHDILNFYRIPIVNWEKIQDIHSSWKKKQFYIDSDSRVQQISTAILNDEYLDWSSWNITFVDEFCVQRILANNHIELRCWGLNQFPTNTKDLKPLLEIL